MELSAHRKAVLLAVAATLLVAAAPPIPNAVASKSSVPVRAEAPPPSDRMSSYELEAVALDRAANQIAADANQLARQQADLGKWQLYLSVVMVVLTTMAAGSAVWAAVYAKRAADGTKRSADAAEKALTGLERPFLLLEVIESGITRDGETITYAPTKYRFRNHGRSPAILTWRYIEYDFSEEGPDPIDPLSNVGHPVPHGVVIAPGGESQVFGTSRALPLIAASKKQGWGP